MVYGALGWMDALARAYAKKTHHKEILAEILDLGRRLDELEYHYRRRSHALEFSGFHALRNIRPGTGNADRELWWEVREEFINGTISIPDDPILIEEISALHYIEDPNGLIIVESKEDLAKRGFDSPNRADCIMMRRFYTPFDVQRMRRANRDRSRREDPDVSWGGGWRKLIDNSLIKKDKSCGDWDFRIGNILVSILNC